MSAEYRDSRVDPLDPEPAIPPDGPGTPIGGSTTIGGRTHPALAHLPEPIARAAVVTLLEAAIARVEGRRWPAHHVERRFIRRWRRWAGHSPDDHDHETEARRIVRTLARLPKPRPATDERRARPAPVRRVLVGRPRS